jgi:hypothetical protein
MPWLMTLAPTNEAIGPEYHPEKITDYREKSTVMIQDVM